MKCIKSILLLCCFVFSTSSLAESWYQVELIIFDRLSPNLGGEQWQNEPYIARDNRVELQPNDVANAEELIPYMVMDKSRNRLGGIQYAFKLSSEYRPLIHLSWQQPATDRRQARYVHLQRLADSSAVTIPADNTVLDEPEFIEEIVQPDYLIDGAIRIRSGFYLHADIDLAYFIQLPEQNKIIRVNEDSVIDQDEKTMIKLKETRKIKLNEIHYFDNPMYGVILQVSRLSAQ